jgi:hypothetical protein
VAQPGAQRLGLSHGTLSGLVFFTQPLLARLHRVSGFGKFGLALHTISQKPLQWACGQGLLGLIDLGLGLGHAIGELLMPLGLPRQRGLKPGTPLLQGAVLKAHLLQAAVALG